MKISDLPLGWLLGASVAEKLEFARELHGEYVGMVELVREGLEQEINRERVQSQKLLVVPFLRQR